MLMVWLEGTASADPKVGNLDLVLSYVLIGFCIRTTWYESLIFSLANYRTHMLCKNIPQSHVDSIEG